MEKFTVLSGVAAPMLMENINTDLIAPSLMPGRSPEDAAKMSLQDKMVGAPGRFVGIDNYLSLFRDEVFLRTAWNSVVYTVVAVALGEGEGMGVAVGVGVTGVAVGPGFGLPSAKAERPL